MKYDLKGFGKRLSQLIQKRYITQSDLATKLNMSNSLLSLYCTGKKKPSVKRTVEICTILNCAPDWLVMGKGSIEDEFQLSLISNLEKEIIPNKISATKIDNMIEIKFFVPQHDFKSFMAEARKEGCF